MARSLRFWLSLGLSTLVTMIIAIMILIVMSALVPRLNDDVENQNRALSEAVASQIEGFLQRFSEEMVHLSQDINASPWYSRQQFRSILDVTTNANQSLQALYVLDQQYRVLEVGLSLPRRAYRDNLKGADFSGHQFISKLGNSIEPIWSETYLSTRGRIVVAIAMAIRLPDSMAKGDQNQGYLVGEIDLAEISRFTRLIGHSDHVIAIVTDHYGNIIGHPDESRSLQQENIGHLDLLRDQLIITDEFVLDGVSYVGTRADIDPTSWTALVAQPTKVAFSTMHTTLWALAIASAVSLSLAIIAAIITSRRMARKVAEFGGHLQAVADGNYLAPLPHSRTDELENLTISMRKMVNAVLEREAGLRDSRAQYRHIVDSTRDLVTRVDTEGNYSFINIRCEEYLGLDREQCLGRSSFDFVVEEDRDITREAFLTWLNSDQLMAHTFDNRIQSINGEIRHVSWSIVPDRLKLADGYQVTGVTSIGRDVTAERAAEKMLAASEKHYRDMFLNAPLPYQSIDANGRILDVNQAWLDLFGRDSHDQVVGVQLSDFLHKQSLALLAETFPRFFREGHIEGPVFEILRPDGSIRTVIQTGRIGEDASGKPRTHCILADITDRLKMEVEQKKIDEQLKLAATVFSSSAEGILITDAEQKIISVNPALQAITGFSEDDVMGKKPTVFSSGRQGEDYYREMWKSIEEKGYWRGEIWNRRRDGEIFPEWLTITAVYDKEEQVSHYIGSFFDISERKKQQEHIEFLAHHDALTRLPNRTLMDDRLRQAIAKSRRNATHTAVLFIDLDRFKLINDTLGHDFGDRLLECVARRLPGVLRETETVARLGGDEFVILIPDLVSVDRIGIIAEKVIEAIIQPIEIDQRTLHVTPSIGISIFPDDGEDPPTLLKNADTAMYHAKERGRNNYQFFTDQMNQEVQERMNLENDLREALKNDEFELHYQPQVNGKNGETTGVEALIRWRHPTRGLVSPMQFVPVAEEIGLIVPIGQWVLQQACMQAKRWHEQGYKDLTICVNLSARQFQDEHLLDHIEQALKLSQLPPQSLELELTESILMENPSDAIQLLQGLAQHGIRLAIDDFGTGYSSLSYLKIFPVHRLKIDRSFVRDLTVDENDAAIVDAVIAMAASLGLAVIAEGVENEDQLNYLIKHGCADIQGYYYSKPRLPTELDNCNLRFPCL